LYKFDQKLRGWCGEKDSRSGGLDIREGSKNYTADWSKLANI
jgi:hypothetical protein